MQRHSRRPWLLLVVVGPLLLAACAGGGGAAPPAAPKTAPAPSGGGAATQQPAARAPDAGWQMRKMTVPYTPVGGPMGPLWIAVEEKLFEKHGLEVTPQFVSGSSPITQSLASGEYDIAVANGAIAALNRLGGGETILIGVHAPYFSIDSWSKPELRTIADLRGKTIGVTRFGSSTHFAAMAMLASAGLQPTDAVILQTGGLGESLAALLSLQADAVMLAPPQNLEARKAGFHQVAVLSQLGEYGLFPETGIIARDAVLREPERRQVGVRFLRAFNEALALTRTDAEVNKRVLRKYTQVDDEEILQATFEFYSKYFPTSMRIDDKTITNMLAFLDDPRAKDADPKLFYDNSLVDEASRSS